VSSFEPHGDGGEVDASEEVGGALVVAGGDCAELLELAEEILDEPAVLVEFTVEVAWKLPMALGRDDRDDTGLSKRFQDARLAVEGLVAEEISRADTSDQGVGAFQVVGLAAR
jgi:hypothetical protein